MKSEVPSEAKDEGLDGLLAGYASGALGAPLHALAEAHLQLKPDNRAFVRDLEMLASRQIANAPPVAVARRETMLETIMAGSLAEVEPAAEAGWPSALSRYGARAETIAWRRLLPGVRACDVSEGDFEATFLRIRPGGSVPAHTHGGEEFTLVLKGGFTDGGRHYGVGDIAIANEHVDHKPVADADEECVCFAVSTAPLRLTGPIGRVFERLRGR